MDIPMKQSRKNFCDQESLIKNLKRDKDNKTSSLVDRSISMSFGSISRSLNSFSKLKDFSLSIGSFSSTESLVFMENISARHLDQLPIYKREITTFKNISSFSC